MESIVNTGLTGKAARSVIPGSKLLSSFQPAADRQVNNAGYFEELGSQLLQGAQQGASATFGICPVLVSAQTLRTQARAAATQEIIYKLSSGYNKGLWPALHRDEPAANLVMPSDAADNASQRQLVTILRQAVATVNNGRGASLLPGTAPICLFDNVDIQCELHKRLFCIQANGNHNVVTSCCDVMLPWHEHSEDIVRSLAS